MHTSESSTDAALSYIADNLQKYDIYNQMNKVLGLVINKKQTLQKSIKKMFTGRNNADGEKGVKVQ